jgi:hypothetical protein
MADTTDITRDQPTRVVTVVPAHSAPTGTDRVQAGVRTVTTQQVGVVLIRAIPSSPPVRNTTTGT